MTFHQNFFDSSEFVCLFVCLSNFWEKETSKVINLLRITILERSPEVAAASCQRDGTAGLWSSLLSREVVLSPVGACSV